MEYACEEGEEEGEGRQQRVRGGSREWIREGERRVRERELRVR